MIGIAVAVLTGLVLKHTVLQDQATPFIMELPPYHMPTLRGVLVRTWDRLKSFVLRAGRVIVPMVLVLEVLNAVGIDGSLGNEDSEKSVLAAVGRTIAPAFAPMGLTTENWPAAVGIFTGVLAKEAVVGTLDAAYTALAARDAAAAGGAASAGADAPFELGPALAGALATIPANLADALGSWAADPLGVSVGDLSDPAAVAEEQEVSRSTFGAMAARFDGTAGAFAYLPFILLCFPCMAAVAAVVQESGTRWALFVAAWTTGMGYRLATLYYQLATWAEHPASSLAWSLAVLGAFGLALLALHRMGRREFARGLPAPQRA
jgi:ferrous iron transport protein B